MAGRQDDFVFMVRTVLKNRAIDMSPTGMTIVMAHRRDAVPSEGASLSLNIPTTDGPPPSPIRLIARKKTAEVNDRIEAGTRLWATVMEGPR